MCARLYGRWQHADTNRNKFAGERCEFEPGIRVEEGTSLEIKDDGEAGVDSLNVTGGNFAAGIGGHYSSGGGDITVSGDAEVTAVGGGYAAGIGGGNAGNGGNITISGGKVTAIGGIESAGYRLRTRTQ